VQHEGLTVCFAPDLPAASFCPISLSRYGHVFPQQEQWVAQPWQTYALARWRRVVLLQQFSLSQFLSSTGRADSLCFAATLHPVVGLWLQVCMKLLVLAQFSVLNCCHMGLIGKNGPHS
jgi:hypothetical protein